MSIEPDRFFSPTKDSNDARFDRALRPQELSDYIGQQAVKEADARSLSRRRGSVVNR